MSLLRPSALLVWAVRDLLRRPGELLLLVAAISALSAVLATPLLLTQGLERATQQILAHSPDLVIRRVADLGTAPIPIEESLGLVKQVAGVTEARCRIWGLARGPQGSVTVHGLDPAAAALHVGEKEALIGAGVAGLGKGAPISLRAASHATFTISGNIPPENSFAGHDAVLLEADSARALLGLPPGTATDLALFVFHEQEAEALLPELEQLFPWPISVVTRRQASGSLLGSLGQRGSLSTLAALPALLAIALLALVAVKERLSRQQELGLLKAMGWSTNHLVRLNLLRASMVLLPGLALGLLAAYLLVFCPGQTWVSQLFLGWQQQPLPLWLDPGGACGILLAVIALVALPWLSATLLAVSYAATRDAQQLLNGGDRR